METTEVTTVKMFNIVTDEQGEILPEEGFDPYASGHLRPKLVSANQKIDQLNQAITDKVTEVSRERSRRFELKNELSEYLQENHEDMDIEHVKAIAEIFDIELNKTVEFKAKIEVTGSVEVPIWTDDEAVFEDVEFSVDLEYGTDGDVDNVSILSIDEK